MGSLIILQYPDGEYADTLGFAIWIDEQERVAWAQGTHEYRPMGVAVVAITGQFRAADFRQSLRRPRSADPLFAGFFGSLETVNDYMREHKKRTLRVTPAHLL